MPNLSAQSRSKKALNALDAAPGVIVHRDPSDFPVAADAQSADEVHIGACAWIHLHRTHSRSGSSLTTSKRGRNERCPDRGIAARRGAPCIVTCHFVPTGHQALSGWHQLLKSGPVELVDLRGQEHWVELVQFVKVDAFR